MSVAHETMEEANVTDLSLLLLRRLALWTPLRLDPSATRTYGAIARRRRPSAHQFALEGWRSEAPRARSADTAWCFANSTS